MTELGPLVEVTVMQSHAMVEALKATAEAPKPPSIVLALIDTGASCSSFDPGIVKNLALLPRGTVPVHTPSTGGVPVQRTQYDATVILGPSSEHPLGLTIPIIECGYAGQGFFVLLGRDVLGHCKLIYDGPRKRFILSWRADAP